MNVRPRILIADSNLAVQAQLGNLLGAFANVISVLKYEQLESWLQEKSQPIDFIFVCDEFISEDIQSFADFWRNHFNARGCDIVVFGKDCDYTEIRALRAGAVGYFRKPFHLELLQYRVELLIKQHRQKCLLETQSSTDPLTNLANRRSLDLFLKAQWGRAQRENTAIGMIMIDVDQFKLYNDCHGHIKGDECLQGIANALSASAKRPCDMVARFGGDEFAIILPSIQRDGMSVVARKIRKNVCLCSIPHVKKAHRPLITVSMGLAWSEPKQGAKPEELLLAADKGLYEAKNSGRDCYSQVIDLCISKNQKKTSA